MSDANDPAFPQTIPVMAKSTEVSGALYRIGEQFTPGLTKREYFAAMAMQGWIANSSRDGKSSDYALGAVAAADALIAALNTEPK